MIEELIKRANEQETLARWVGERAYVVDSWNSNKDDIRFIALHVDKDILNKVKNGRISAEEVSVRIFTYSVN
jgi:hypothetical protein